MTPEDKERWRWTFAGQAMQAVTIAASTGTKIEWSTDSSKTPEVSFCATALRIADALIAELEKTAPKMEYESKHTGTPNCPICAATVVYQGETFHACYGVKKG